MKSPEWVVLPQTSVVISSGRATRLERLEPVISSAVVDARHDDVPDRGVHPTKHRPPRCFTDTASAASPPTREDAARLHDHRMARAPSSDCSRRATSCPIESTSRSGSPSR